MKRRSLFRAATGAVLASGFMTAAHAEDQLAKVKAAGVLRVGTETAFAPFDFIDAGKHAGLNVDLFDALGKDMGWKIEWVTLPWEGVLPGLEAGKFDMVAGPATITKARMERYDFSPPIAEATVALLKRANEKDIVKPEDIAGKTVGSGKATAQLAQLKAFVEKLPGKTEVREYVSFNEAYADLAAGRIVAVANSLPNIAYVAEQRKGAFAVVKPAFGSPSYFGFIYRKDPEFASLNKAVTGAILKMKADGRLGKLQDKWFGQTFDTPDAVANPSV